MWGVKGVPRVWHRPTKREIVVVGSVAVVAAEFVLLALTGQGNPPYPGETSGREDSS